MTRTWIVVWVVALGLLVQGCGDHRGGPAPVGQANLIVDNTENHSMTVIVDGSSFATVEAEGSGSFYVVPGPHRVEVRYGNDLMPTYDRGTIVFPDTNTPGFQPVRLS